MNVYTNPTFDLYLIDELFPAYEFNGNYYSVDGNETKYTPVSVKYLFNVRFHHNEYTNKLISPVFVLTNNFSENIYDYASYLLIDENYNVQSGTGRMPMGTLINVSVIYLPNKVYPNVISEADDETYTLYEDLLYMMNNGIPLQNLNEYRNAI